MTLTHACLQLDEKSLNREGSFSLRRNTVNVKKVLRDDVHHPHSNPAYEQLVVAPIKTLRALDDSQRGVKYSARSGREVERFLPKKFQRHDLNNLV
ncbi:MAG: hypothetical protein ABJA70_21640, partial [Chryseolinea sp.]